jgi:60 kDa SS-A/Ro ribonucleoprotein
MQELPSIESFTHPISFEENLNRIIMLGTQKQKYSSVSSANNLDEGALNYIRQQILAGNGYNILKIVRDIYIEGRAPKQDILFMIHAMLCRARNDGLRKKSLEFLKEYRTISQLYAWKQYHTKIPNAEGIISKGFGRGVKNNLNQWILTKTPEAFAYQATKYIKRGDWGIVDLLKCIHTNTTTGDDRVFVDSSGIPIINAPKKKKETKTMAAEATATPMDLVLRYTVEGYDKMKLLAEKFKLMDDKMYKYLTAIHLAKKSTSADLEDEEKLGYLIKIIQHFRLSREQVSTESLTNTRVQLALLLNEDCNKVTMPFTALLRNLANLTRVGVFDAPQVLDLVIAHLKNAKVIEKSRIHPVQVLIAWFTYRRGVGKLSKHSWMPLKRLIDALEELFYLSFKYVAPTGKRICFLIDCSGSMTSESLCDGVTNAEIAALLAMVFCRAETNSKHPIHHSFYIFSNGITDVSDLIHSKASFLDVLKAVQRSNFSCTDISKGILKAIKYNRVYDGFVVITDNDVNSGANPSIALKQYRAKMNIPTKLAVVATQLNDLSIADPQDKGMMDFCGFDSHGPKLLQEFFTGKTTSPTEEDNEGDAINGDE